MSDLQLWGGCECTVNRVGDCYFDQTVRSGHHGRMNDLRLFADLGVRVLRYPVLWKRVSPHSPGEADFSWNDEWLDIRYYSAASPGMGCLHGLGL